MYKVEIKPLMYRVVVRIKEDEKTVVSCEAHNIFFFFDGRIELKLGAGFEVLRNLTRGPGFLFFIMAFSDVHKREQYSELPCTCQLPITSILLLLFQLSLTHNYFLLLFLLEYLQQILNIICFHP